jgi:hypothetical protein
MSNPILEKHSSQSNYHSWYVLRREELSPEVEQVEGRKKQTKVLRDNILTTYGGAAVINVL